MIRYINGELAMVGADSVIIEANGIGWRIYVPASALSALPHIGDECKLYTYLQVREDAMSLFGFLSMDELLLFEMLIGVNGVGPKAALGVLGVLAPNDLKFAILSGDAKAISRAPGVGTKTAQRVVMELKDKLSLEDAFAERTDALWQEQSAQPDAAQDAVLGLVALGYGRTDAARAVRGVKDADGLSADALLKEALKALL